MEVGEEDTDSPEKPRCVWKLPTPSPASEQSSGTAAT